MADNPLPRLEADEVKREARGRWESIISSLAPKLDPALQRVGKHVDCPFHGGKDDFRLFKDVAETGGAICSCGKWSDGFALLMHANNWSFPEVIQEVGRYLGLTDQAELQKRRKPDPKEEARRERERAEKEAERQERDKKLRQSLNRVWQEAVPLTASEAEPVRLYFARRGLRTKDLPKNLKCHPALGYHHEGKMAGKWPCLVALAQDAKGDPCTLHRIYLTDEGHKAPTPDEPKKLMPYPSDRKLSGGAIRLAEPGEVLGLAEGIETSFAVMLATGIPVWSTISAGLLSNVEIPKFVKFVVIYADKDRSGGGQKAAIALAKTLREQGIEVGIVVPPMDIPEDKKSVDWNDALLRYGPKGIPDPEKVRKALAG